jgi:hypothetical protein
VQPLNLAKNQSLTPNPKQQKRNEVELDFKSLQNYVLSNIDSSEKNNVSSEDRMS